MKLIFICFFSLLYSVTLIGQSTPMRLVPKGIYQPLYSSDSQKVSVKKFEMDIYAVTNLQFVEFVKKNPQWKKSKVKRIFADSLYLHHWKNDTIINKELEQEPVVNVSWFAAKAYCECLGKRLPTNAEWELAAQASITKKNGYLDSNFNQQLLDWVARPQPKGKRNVGSTFKNIYGIYDMHGLIWEWTHDFNSALTTGESRENSALDKSFFCGGGSFNSKDTRNYAAFMRFAMRSSLKARYNIGKLGFRCIK